MGDVAHALDASLMMLESNSLRVRMNDNEWQQNLLGLTKNQSEPFCEQRTTSLTRVRFRRHRDVVVAQCKNE